MIDSSANEQWKYVNMADAVSNRDYVNSLGEDTNVYP